MKYQWNPDKGAPESTKFMGRVRFRNKGGYVDVTDPMVLKKLANHQEFKLKPEKAPKKAVVEEVAAAGPDVVTEPPKVVKKKARKKAKK